MIHGLAPSGRWTVAHPIVVGRTYQAYAWPKEVDEIAFEAWERMTYGGMSVGLHHLMPYSQHAEPEGYRTVYVTR